MLAKGNDTVNDNLRHLSHRMTEITLVRYCRHKSLQMNQTASDTATRHSTNIPRPQGHELVQVECANALTVQQTDAFLDCARIAQSQQLDQADRQAVGTATKNAQVPKVLQLNPGTDS